MVLGLLWLEEGICCWKIANINSHEQQEKSKQVTALTEFVQIQRSVVEAYMLQTYIDLKQLKLASPLLILHFHISKF